MATMKNTLSQKDPSIFYSHYRPFKHRIQLDAEILDPELKELVSMDYFSLRPKLSVDVSTKEYSTSPEGAKYEPITPATPAAAMPAAMAAPAKVGGQILGSSAAAHDIPQAVCMQDVHSNRNSMITGGSLTPLEDMGLIINENQPNCGSFSFLLVDDNPVNLKILERVLAKIFPSATITAMSDSMKVMETVRSREFDVVFLDIEMPGVDGIELTKMMRADKRYDTWGLVAVTTRVSEADLAVYEAIGMDHTFSKPLSYNYDWLMDAITGVIRERVKDSYSHEVGI